LQVAGALVNPKATMGEKMKALPGIAAFYSTWYPTRYFGWGHWPKYSEFGRLATHLRFCDRSARRLARQIFHGMAVHQAALQRKQGFLSRIVHIGLELLAMSASISRVRTMEISNHPHAAEAAELADLFCRDARRRINRWFRDLWSNADKLKYQVAMNVLEGRHVWLEEGTVTVEERLAQIRSKSGPAAESESPREAEKIGAGTTG
jgi:hypothetical protein